MTTFATENRLLSLYDLPVSSPEVTLEPLSWLAVATVVLPANSQLDLLWLTVSVPSSSTVATPVVNPDFLPGGLVTAYLISNWSPDMSPWLQNSLAFLACPAVNPTTAVLPLIASMPGNAVTTTVPLPYTIVLCNNTTNMTYNASVTGALSVDTDP